MSYWRKINLIKMVWLDDIFCRAERLQSWYCVICSDLFQRRGHTQETLIVPESQTAKERSFLLAQRPRQPHEERPGQEAVCVTGITEHMNTWTEMGTKISFITSNLQLFKYLYPQTFSGISTQEYLCIYVKHIKNALLLVFVFVVKHSTALLPWDTIVHYMAFHLGWRCQCT